MLRILALAPLASLCILPAQSPSLVKDLNTSPVTTASSTPRVIEAAGGLVYVAANADTVGTELYSTVGGPGGINLVKDIHPGIGNSYPSDFHAYNNKTLFAASDGSNGRELWVTDGSIAGTVMLKDIVAGAGSSNPARFQDLGGKAYFLTGEGTNNVRNSLKEAVGAGGDLWCTDGTAAGTVLVKKFLNTPAALGATNMLLVGTTLFLVADDGSGTGAELWKSDGTTAGTVFVKDIYPGSTSGNPNDSQISELTSFQNKLFFRARSGANANNELWSSDGTPAGTAQVLDINPGNSGSSPRYLTVLGNLLLFSANDGSNGYELWRSDGTTAGTVLVQDIRGGAGGGSPTNTTTVDGTRRFAVLGSKVYFRANDGSSGNELWSSDGTAAGTNLVADLRSGTASGSPNYITTSGNFLYFAANAGSGVELYKSDGTAAGTALVKDINQTSATASSSPALLAPSILGGVVFRANDGSTGIEPWYSDGTAAGTQILADLYKGQSSDTLNGNPRELLDVNGTLFFYANDGSTGNELYISDGTAAGTSRVADIRAGSGSSSPTWLTELDGRVVFRASDSSTGNELWISDGTTAGTTLIKDIRTGPGSSSPNYLTHDGRGTIYFSANDGSGNELWKTDGTAAGTVQVKDINQSSPTTSSSPAELVMMNGILYFRANDGINGNELWRSDGTAAGTTMVANINAGSSSGTPQRLTPDGQGLLYFAANNGTGTELFRSDGTSAGTALVKDINQSTGTASSTPNYLTPLGSKMLFVANDGSNGVELWVSDGTTAGTVLLKDINPGAGNSAAGNSYGQQNRTRQFARLGNELYFSANDGSSGAELWKTDGTAAGTVRVLDLNPDGSAAPMNITPVGSRHLVFRATDGNNGSGMGTGTELWITDGTSAGTQRLTDINPADNGANPAYPTLSAGRLMFAATDGRKGIELWSLDLDATSQPIGRACGGQVLPSLNGTDPVLGGTVTLNASGPSHPILALLLGATQNRLQTSIGSGCHVYANLALPTIVQLAAPAANGDWSAQFAVPTSASLQGVEVTLQVGYGPSFQPPLGIDLSNGLKMVLGN